MGLGAVKSSIVSSASSKTQVMTAVSSSCTPKGGRDRSEGRGDSSSYFPGCRKDTNCKCKICLASIHATLDLIPTGSSITNLTNLPKRVGPAAEAAIEPETPPSTPEVLATTSSSSLTLPIESTAKSRPKNRDIRVNKERNWAVEHWKLLLLGIFFIMMVYLGFLKDVIEGFEPTLKKEILEKFGQESRDRALDLRGKLTILEQKIGGIVDGVLNCSSLNSSWEMNQIGGQFIHWRCIIYESVAEEVSVWGGPLQTSGLLSTGLSSRSLTLLSGRITEWSDGKLESTSRTGNGSSWTLQGWMTVAVQLESNTWVLEYKRSVIFDGPGVLPATLKLLRLRFINMLKLVKLESWRLLTRSFISDAFYHHPEGDGHFMHPT